MLPIYFIFLINEESILNKRSRCARLVERGASWLIEAMKQCNSALFECIIQKLIINLILIKFNNQIDIFIILISNTNLSLFLTLEKFPFILLNDFWYFYIRLSFNKFNRRNSLWTLLRNYFYFYTFLFFMARIILKKTTLVFLNTCFNDYLFFIWFLFLLVQFFFLWVTLLSYRL